MSSNPPGDNGGVFNRRALILVAIGAAGVLGLVIVIRFISAKKTTTGQSVAAGTQVGTDSNGNPIYAQPGGGDQFVNEIAYQNTSTGTQNVNGNDYLGPNSGNTNNTNTDINYQPTHIGFPPGPIVLPVPVDPIPHHPPPRNPPPSGGHTGPPSPPPPPPRVLPGPVDNPPPPPVRPPVNNPPNIVRPPAPTPAPRPTPQPTPSNSPRMYTVQAGDTLASIARRFNIGGGAATLGRTNDTTLKQVAVGHGISPAATSRYGSYPAAWDYIYPGENIRLQ